MDPNNIDFNFYLMTEFSELMKRRRSSKVAEVREVRAAGQMRKPRTGRQAFSFLVIHSKRLRKTDKLWEREEISSTCVSFLCVVVFLETTKQIEADDREMFFTNDDFF